MGKNNKKKRDEKHHIMKHSHAAVATTTSSKNKMRKNARKRTKRLAQTRMKHQNNYDASSASWRCRHCQSKGLFSTYSLVALHESICTAARSSSSSRRRMYVRSDKNTWIQIAECAG